MNDTNPFAIALDVIKHDHTEEKYFDRLIEFTTEFARLSRECQHKADLYALNFVRERIASITAKLELQIVFSSN
jgi:hypothetical protein